MFVLSIDRMSGPSAHKRCYHIRARSYGGLSRCSEWSRWDLWSMILCMKTKLHVMECHLLTRMEVRVGQTSAQRA